MTWMLVDGNNWFARDWYATKHTIKPDLTAQFLKRVMMIKHQFEFDRVVVAWDSPNSFRKQFCETYKSNREGKSDDFIAALRKVQADAPNTVDCLWADGFEADDILATLTQIAHHEGERVVLFSSDKDLFQLLRKDAVSQCTLLERASLTQYELKSVMTADKLLAKFKVRPHQWVDYRVIAGDKSDGIAGIDGLGPSVAEKVLSKVSCLDRFYHSPFSVALTGRQRALLMNSRPQWADLRRLLTLRTDVPIPATWFESLHSIASSSGATT